MHALQPITARLSSITTLDGSDLEYVDNYKYLGVWLDCKLSFQTHIKHLQSKIKTRIGVLFRNKASFSHAAKHILVRLIILPILDFDDVIYKIASNTLLNKCRCSGISQYGHLRSSCLFAACIRHVHADDQGPWASFFWCCSESVERPL
ncbi:unnamed protein product [Oncorhynchus mykiss]|uniref:Alkylated DNA repair protein AlkB homologue 8 N-terminal domain-containing protein n=1 Tax=Oncorhynchus mykiss TaxID=8022 RepID=A0A060X5Q8_ONCMY|nr:unnamed protein product [Oncorhynchus mykiss]